MRNETEQGRRSDSLDVLKIVDLLVRPVLLPDVSISVNLGNDLCDCVGSIEDSRGFPGRAEGGGQLQFEMRRDWKEEDRTNSKVKFLAGKEEERADVSLHILIRYLGMIGPTLDDELPDEDWRRRENKSAGSLEDERNDESRLTTLEDCKDQRRKFQW